MLTKAILAQTSRVLTQAQRTFYFENGYLLVENLIDAETLARLNSVTAEFVELSRSKTESDEVHDLAPGHSADRPLVRRLKTPDAQHPSTGISPAA